MLVDELIIKKTVLRWADSVNLTCVYELLKTVVWCLKNLRILTDAYSENIGCSIEIIMWIVNSDNFHQLSVVGYMGEIVISEDLLKEEYFADQTITDVIYVLALSWMREMKFNVSLYNMLYRFRDLT